MHLQVVMGLIFNAQSQILVAQRQKHQDAAGLWEFPGGKIEPGETALAALKREIREEVGVEITHAIPFLKYDYQYPDKTISLDTWKVISYQGEPWGCEGQTVVWLNFDLIPTLKFPAGNQKLLEFLCP